MAEHASVHLRWSLLLDDHPDTPPATYEVSRGEGLVPSAFAGSHPFCVATISIPGRAASRGYRSLQGVRQGDSRAWLECCVDALDVALDVAGYPRTIQDLKALARWRQLKESPLLEHAAEEGRPSHHELVDLDTVMASLGARRPALEAWAKDQGIWPPDADNVDRLLARAAELAADEVFGGEPADEASDPVAAAREFLADRGVPVPESEPIVVSGDEVSEGPEMNLEVDAATTKMIRKLDERLATVGEDDLKKVARFCEDSHLPLLLEEMDRPQLAELIVWLDDEGIG